MNQHDQNRPHGPTPKRRGVFLAISLILTAITTSTFLSSPALANPTSSSCNQPPGLTLELSNTTAQEGKPIAILAEVINPSTHRVIFEADFSNIFPSGQYGDEPEFFVDPGRPLANLYWVPSVGRGNTSYTVRFRARYESSDWGEWHSQSIYVTPKPAASVEIRNKQLVTASVNGTPCAGFGEGATVVMREGNILEVKNIDVNTTGVASDPKGELKNLLVDIIPDLGSAADLPRVTTHWVEVNGNWEKRFKVIWAPNHTRAGTTPPTTYTLTLKPFFENVCAPSSSAFMTFYVTVKDQPLITYPQDYITIPAGQSFDFTVLTDNYGGNATVSATEQPVGSSFDSAQRRFQWTPGTEDIGKRHVLTLASTDVNTTGLTDEATILLGVTTNGNLVINPDAIYDVDTNGVPDAWYKSGTDADPNGHTLDWITATGQLLSHRHSAPEEETIMGNRAHVGWAQKVYLTSSSESFVAENAVYEFEVSYRLEDIRFNLNSNGHTVDAGWKNQVGVSLAFYSDRGERLSSAYWANPITTEMGADKSTWSNTDGCYHNLNSNGTSWTAFQTFRSYTTPPSGTRYARILTVNRAQGKLYVDSASLREVNENPHIPAFSRSGSVNLLHNKDKSEVFLIGTLGKTPQDYGGVTDPDTYIPVSERLDLYTMRKTGFNTIGYTSSRVGGRDEHLGSGLYAIGHAYRPSYFHVDGDSTSSVFHEGHASYMGIDNADVTAPMLASAAAVGLDILAIEGPDEPNHSTQKNGTPNLNPDGTWELTEMEYIKGKVLDVINKPYLIDYCAVDRDPKLNEAFARLVDMVVTTWNSPLAYTVGLNTYSNPKEAAIAWRVGEMVRRWQKDLSEVSNNATRYVLGHGFAVSRWSCWDTTQTYNTNLLRKHEGPMVPYHLQRYQVYNQIVNGACGIRFHGAGWLSLDNPYERYQWSQIQQLAEELAVLQDLHATPEYYDEWNASPNWIEAMLKKRDGKIYLIATNPTEDVLEDVTIQLSGSEFDAAGIPGIASGIASVTALFENDRTNTTYSMPNWDDGFIDPSDAEQIRRRGWTRTDWRRQIPTLQIDGLSFTDKFLDYGVHIYEIVLDYHDSDADGLPDYWESKYGGGLRPDDDLDYCPAGQEGDGLTNIEEYNRGSHPWQCDTDNDQHQDGYEVHVLNTDPTRADTDSDGHPDNADNCPYVFNRAPRVDGVPQPQIDSDNDGVGDACDACPTLYAGTLIGCPDCNNNFAPDECDITSGTSMDCNTNGVPDECDLAAGTSADCNSNGIPDECETGGTEDCNTNGTSDLCDIYNNVSSDCNANAVPDECEILPAAILFVDNGAVDGLNDGSSWTHAYLELQTALDHATCVVNGITEIRVAQGTYYPDTSDLTDAREAAFQLINGVTISGGYAGYGTALPEQRNILQYETVLSGDLGTTGDASDNAYHVFFDPPGISFTGTAVLDGVTITGGNANGTSGSPGYYDCGGGIFNYYPSSPTITNCTFRQNSATKRGGAICNHNTCSPTISNCLFTNNSAAGTSGYGGAIYNYISSPVITDCSLIDNSANGWSGAVHTYRGAPSFLRCEFINNSAEDAGALTNYGCSPSFVNCVFDANSANVSGGAVRNYTDNPVSTPANPTLTNCTFAGNSTTATGETMHNHDSNPVLTNCILWDVTSVELTNSGTSTPVVTYTCINGGYTGTGNINVDPYFFDANGPDNILGTADDDLTLSYNSPCIDAADNIAVPTGVTTDFNGDSRFVDDTATTDTGNGTAPIVDMGAYEYDPT